MRLNEMMSAQYRGCPVLYEFMDPHRNRVVKVFDIGDTEVLGIADGVDAWALSPGMSVNGRTCASIRLHPQQKRIRHALIEQQADQEEVIKSRTPTHRVKLRVD